MSEQQKTIHIDKKYEPPEWKKPKKKATKHYSKIGYQNSSLRKRRLKK